MLVWSRLLRQGLSRSARSRAPRSTVRPRLESLEGRIVPTTYFVTNPLDDGLPGSLRQAIADANANAGPDTIEFATPAFDVPQAIFLKQGQLNISDPVTITGPGTN